MSKQLGMGTPCSMQVPEEGEILKIDCTGRITTGCFIPHTSYAHWWRAHTYYGDFLLDEEEKNQPYNDLFAVAKAFGVTQDEVQALLDYGCSEEEIETCCMIRRFCIRLPMNCCMLIKKGGLIMDWGTILLGIAMVLGELLSGDDDSDGQIHCIQ